MDNINLVTNVNSLPTTHFDRKHLHTFWFQHTICHKCPAESHIFKHEQLHAIQFQLTVCYKNSAESYIFKHEQLHAIQFQLTVCYKNPAKSYIFKHEQLHAIYHTMYFGHPSAMADPLLCFVHSIYSFFFVKCSEILSLFSCSSS